jgi:protein-ribulosamine 3-kinase
VKSVITAALREALTDPALEVKRLVPTGGGCINNAARVETSAGDVFVKWNETCPDDLFLREAEGLREIAAVATGLVVPGVLGAWGPREGRPAMIVLEYLPPGRSSGDDETLGRGLAALHRRRASLYGFATPTYCGTTRQDNTWTTSWIDFYRDRRLAAVLALIEAERGLSASDRATYERLFRLLPELLPHAPPPALIHGDLWSGNVVQTARGPGLVDPGSAYTDREMEFGITTLFGGFSERFWKAYEETWPLPHGWRERNPIYQLYHLLNHHALFGGHYGSQALTIARRYA